MSIYKVGQQKCKNSDQVYVHKRVKKNKGRFQELLNLLNLICTTIPTIGQSWKK